MSISREALIKALKSAEVKETAVTNSRRGRVGRRIARRRSVRNAGDDEDEEEEDVEDLPIDGDIEDDADDVDVEDEGVAEEGDVVLAKIVDVAPEEAGEDDGEYEEVTTENLRRRFRKVKNARIVRNGRGGYTVLAPVSKKYRKVKNSRWARLVRNADTALDGRYKSVGDVESGYDEPEPKYAEELQGVDEPKWDGYKGTNNARRRQIINARKARAYDAIVARARRIRNAQELEEAVRKTTQDECQKLFKTVGTKAGGFGGGLTQNSRTSYFRIKNYRVYNADGEDVTAETVNDGQQPQQDDQQVIQLELVIDGGQDIQPEDIDVQVAGEGIPQEQDQQEQEAQQPTADPAMNDQGQQDFNNYGGFQDGTVKNCGRTRNARRRVRNARRRFASVRNEEHNEEQKEVAVENAAQNIDVAPLDVPSTFPEKH